MVKELADKAAQGRTYGNLGNTYYLLGEFEKAVAAHEKVSFPVGIQMNVADGHIIPDWTYFWTWCFLVFMAILDLLFDQWHNDQFLCFEATPHRKRVWG